MRSKTGMFLVMSLLLVGFLASPARAGLTSNVWLVKSDGSEANPLTDFTDLLYIAWDMSPDGKLVVVGASGQLYQYSLTGQKTVLPIDPSLGEASLPVWHPDGTISYLASDVTSRRRTIAVFSWPNGPTTPLVELGTNMFPYERDYISPDRTLALIAKQEEEDRYSFFIVDLKRGVWHKLPITWFSYTWSPPGEYVAIGDWDSRTLYLVTREGEITPWIEERFVAPLAWTPDGRSLLVASGERQLEAIDAPSGQSMKPLPSPMGVLTAAVSPDGSRVAFVFDERWTDEQDPSSSLWLSDWSNPPRRLLDAEGGWLSRLEWLPDGSGLLVEMAGDPECMRPFVYNQTIGQSDAGLPDEPDFRNVSWGMTRQQVKLAEGDAYVRVVSPDVLGVWTGLNDAIMYYYFSGDQLSAAAYVFPREMFLDPSTWSTLKRADDYWSLTSNLMINDFEERQARLTEIYGPPQSYRVVWREGCYQDDRDKWGDALFRGDVRFECTWDTPRTKIILWLARGEIWTEYLLVFLSKEIPSQLWEDYFQKRSAEDSP